jgi:hypothetical protein
MDRLDGDGILFGILFYFCTILQFSKPWMEALVNFCYSMNQMNTEREVIWQTLQSYFVELQITKASSFPDEQRKSRFSLLFEI